MAWSVERESVVALLWFSVFYVALAIVVTFAEPVAVAVVVGFCLLVVRDRLAVLLRSSAFSTAGLVVGLVLLSYWLMLNLNDLAHDISGLAYDIRKLGETVVPWVARQVGVSPELVRVYFDEGVGIARHEVTSLVSLRSLSVFADLALYVMLMPVLLVMFLSEHRKMLPTLYGFVPANSRLVRSVLDEWLVEIKVFVWVKNVEAMFMIIGAYVLMHWVFGLNYALILSVLVGLSVFFPFIGPLVVLVPVLSVALMQFDLSYTLIVGVSYGAMQCLGGFVLQPFLCGKKMMLSPFAVLVFIVLFGSTLGIWGLLLSVPILTFVLSVKVAWKQLIDLNAALREEITQEHA
ncbi:AI-2E family transporter [Vibrio sp. PNB22_3_1]